MLVHSCVSLPAGSARARWPGLPSATLSNSRVTRACCVSGRSGHAFMSRGRQVLGLDSVAIALRRRRRAPKARGLDVPEQEVKRLLFAYSSSVAMTRVR